MNISELHKTTDPFIWGVIPDADVFDPPAHIRKIGLLWEGTGPREISDRLIDIIIAFNLSGAEVVLEIRPTDEVDAEYVLTLAGNAGFSVSIIPPEDEEDLEAWCAQCENFAGALLVTPNFAAELHPVTGFVSYLTLEIFTGADSLVPTDPYILDRFYTAIPEAWSGAAKARMRQRMEEMLDGPDGLKDYLGAAVKAIQSETKKTLLGILRDMKSV